MVTLVLGLAATLGVQLCVFGRGWLGPAAPDPTVCVLAFAALALPARSHLVLAVSLGWARALVLAEPAGGQILCAWLALAVVASQREALVPVRAWGFVAASVLAAVAWMGGAWLLDSLAGAAVTAGPGLLAGAALALPLAGTARRAGRAAGLAT